MECTCLLQGKLHKKPCLDVYELNTTMNRWSKVGGDSQLRLDVRPTHPCFFYQGKLFIISMRHEILMFGCDTGENKEIRVSSNDPIKHVLHHKAQVCCAMHKHIAMITSYMPGQNKNDLILLLDLKKLNALFDDVPVRSTMQGPASDVDLGSILVLCVSLLNDEDVVNVLGMTVFGGDVVAVVRTKNNDVCVYGCDADQLCFDVATQAAFKKLYQLRFRHMNEEIRVRNIKRIRLHTLLANMT